MRSERKCATNVETKENMGIFAKNEQAVNFWQLQHSRNAHTHTRTHARKEIVYFGNFSVSQFFLGNKHQKVTAKHMMT